MDGRSQPYQELCKRRVCSRHSMQAIKSIQQHSNNLDVEVCTLHFLFHFVLCEANLGNSYSADIVGDVSYDAFLGNSSCGGPGDPHTYEIMVWLAQLGGLDPIGSVQATAQIGGSPWDLWVGPNTQTGATVFSFVAKGAKSDYSGDLMDFMDYVVKNNGVDASLFLTSVQAGTEVATGDAKFSTSKYTIFSS